MGVKTVLIGQAESTVLLGETKAREKAVPEIAEPGAGVRKLGGRVEDAPLRSGVVPRLPVGAATPIEEVTAGMLHVGVGADLPAGAGGIGAQPPSRTVEQRVAVALGRCEQIPIGRMRCDHVDEADDVGPVEQRGRSACDLDPLGAARVDRDSMMIRGAGKVACRDPVLNNVHPVAAEPADDRPARPGSEAAVRNARLVVERFSDAAGCIPGNLEGVERADGIECPERRLGPHSHLGGDVHFLAHQQQAQCEI